MDHGALLLAHRVMCCVLLSGYIADACVMHGVWGGDFVCLNQKGCVHTDHGSEEQGAAEEEPLTTAHEALTDEPRAPGGQWAPTRPGHRHGKEEVEGSGEEAAPGVLECGGVLALTTVVSWR